MAKATTLDEVGTSGIPVFAGRFEERYLADLNGPEGLQKLGAILRTEPAAFTAHRMILVTAQQAKWRVVPASEDEADIEAADFVQSCIDDMAHAFGRAISFALSCQAFGFADLEIVWKRRNGRDAKGAGSKFDDGLIGIRKLGVRRQETVERWEFDEQGGPQTMIQRDPTTFKTIEIPIEKILHFVGGDDRGSWEGLGWLEPAYKLYHMIQNYEIIEGVGHQRSHVGLPVFKWLQVPGPDDKSAVEQIGRKLIVNEQAYVMLPGPLVEFSLETVSNSNATALADKINQLRWELMGLVAITFMRLGSTDSGSRALGDTLTTLFAQSIDGALSDMAEVFNRHLIPRLFEANASKFGGITDYPHLEPTHIYKIPMQAMQWLDSVQRYLDTATYPDAAWVRDVMGMPEISEEDQDALVKSKQAQQATPVASAMPFGLASTEQPAGGEAGTSTPATETETASASEHSGRVVELSFRGGQPYIGGRQVVVKWNTDADETYP